MRATYLAASALLAISTASAVVARPIEEDPFAWLEEIEGQKPLEWVRAENAKTLRTLQSDPRYADLETKALTILQAQDRIPYVQMRANWLYNLWQDATHTRGLWRRTTLDSYRSGTPTWESVLDLDALATAENRNWVYAGNDCLAPTHRYCLIKLSDGGKDASLVREFDTTTKSFVIGGFALPEGKQTVVWVDKDTILVARDWGAGTMTKSGYPFVVKELKRGQSLDQAREVFRGTADDALVMPMVIRDNAGVTHAIGAVRALNTFDTEITVLTQTGAVKLNLPKKSSFAGVLGGRLLVKLSEDWAIQSQSFKADSLLSYDLAKWKRDPLTAQPSLVFEPKGRQTLSDVATTRNKLILTILDNVRGKAFAYEYRGGAWQKSQINLPQDATLSIATTSDNNDLAMFAVTDYLTPTTLILHNAATGTLEPIKASPARFDASKHLIEQLVATSKDGTKIPYFLVRPKNMKRDGSMPTLLYGYGGFQLSQVPYYSGTLGKLWLEQGNAYVVANIRGGGEFGPAWHQAAQNANKQRTWDDYLAVAEDLISRRISSPRRLGAVGGSQGGLLVGTAITQRPDLFNAAIVQVPLLDMLRYHKLGAGSSWTGEYGDPEIAEDRAWISAYSPYQKLVAGKRFPTPFFLTSTKDDRVHPAHGRKAAARLAALGQPYFYYENIDGGHSAAANLKETARREALEYTYALRQLAE